jgi:hypothetical protein
LHLFVYLHENLQFLPASLCQSWKPCHCRASWWWTHSFFMVVEFLGDGGCIVFSWPLHDHKISWWWRTQSFFMIVKDAKVLWQWRT